LIFSFTLKKRIKTFPQVVVRQHDHILTILIIPNLSQLCF